jgi:hypothetical protein
MIVPKVLIDGGAGLNIIFADTLKKIGERCKMARGGVNSLN